MLHTSPGRDVCGLAVHEGFSSFGGVWCCHGDVIEGFIRYLVFIGEVCVLVCCWHCGYYGNQWRENIFHCLCCYVNRKISFNQNCFTLFG